MAAATEQQRPKGAGAKTAAEAQGRKKRDGGGRGAEETRRWRHRSNSGRGEQGLKKKDGGGRGAEETRWRRQQHAIMNLVFKTYNDRIDELRSQLKLVESISVDIVELMLVSQYCDTTGTIAWSGLSKEIACTMAVVAQQSATNMQSAGIGL